MKILIPSQFLDKILKEKIIDIKYRLFRKKLVERENLLQHTHAETHTRMHIHTDK